MSEPQGPWSRPPDRPPAPPPKPAGGATRRGLFLWLGVLALAGGGVFWMMKSRPLPMSGEDQGWALQYIAMLAVVSSGLVYGRAINLGQTARHAALWVLVVGLLTVGYAYRNDLLDVGRRVRAEVVPGYAVKSTPGEMVLTHGEGGQFYVMAQVNGAPVRFAVDTGASEIVLSPADARRAGLDMDALRYVQSYETANGVGRGALAKVGRLQVGTATFTDVDVSVNGAPMSTSLLGMTFLRRLESFEVRGDRLVLRWRAPAPTS